MHPATCTHICCITMPLDPPHDHELSVEFCNPCQEAMERAFEAQDRHHRRKARPY
jgi:hypothetical protein